MYCAPPQSHCAAVVVDDDDNYINNNDDDDDEDYKLNAFRFIHLYGTLLRDVLCMYEWQLSLIIVIIASGYFVYYKQTNDFANYLK